MKPVGARILPLLLIAISAAVLMGACASTSLRGGSTVGVNERLVLYLVNKDATEAVDSAQKEGEAISDERYFDPARSQRMPLIAEPISGGTLRVAFGDEATARRFYSAITAAPAD
jgi:hypothetical protein